MIDPMQPTDDEAFRTLVDLAEKRTGAVPATALARHILAVTPQAPWPVRRAALEAIVRRRAAARRDELVVQKAPATGTGRYVVAAGDSGRRPYATVLWSMEPLRGACDCADFIRNSLGLCKHLWVAVERVYAQGVAGSAPTRTPALRWDPVRPLLGRGDWLARVVLEQEPGHGNARETETRAAAVRSGAPAPTLFHEAQLTSPHERRAALIKLRRALDDARAPDPSLLALAWREERLLAEREAGAVDEAAADRALVSLRRTLLPYQRAGVQRFLDDVRLLLADDMGLGKTAQAIAGCHVLWQTQRARRGVVVVPASLKPQWAREWQAFTDTPLRVVEGTPEERRAQYASLTAEPGFLLLGYEQLVRDIDVVCALDTDVVVLDEAQRIKNWATKTFQAVARLKPRHRLVLTGTPLENRLEELATLLDWLDETALAPAWRIDALHILRADGRSEIRGVTHLDTVRARTAHVLVRRTRKEVLGQLPTRRDTQIAVPWTGAQADAHAEEDEVIARLASILARRPLRPEEHLRLMAALTRQRMACSGMALLDFNQMWPAVSSKPPTPAMLDSLSSPKLAEARALIEALAVVQGRKVVVFSQWRRMLELVQWAVSDVLAAHGLRALFFSGQERAARRTQNIVDFHDDDNARVLLCTDAGGVGLNLQRAASAAVCLELPWNPAVLEQRIARVHRMGQAHPVDVYVLGSSDGIEARIAQIVAGKQALFRELFDGTSDEIAVDGGGGLLAHVRALAGLDASAAARSDEQPAPAAGPLAEEPSSGRDLDDAGSAAEYDRRASDDGLGTEVIDSTVADLGGSDMAAHDAELHLRDGAEDPESDLSSRADDVDRRPTEPVAASQSATSHSSEVAAPEARPTAASTSYGPAPAVAESIAALFAQVRIAPRADGGLTIDAPPAAARGLAALFTGFGALLAQVSRTGGEGGEG